MPATHAMRGREARAGNQHFPSCPEAGGQTSVGAGDCTCLTSRPELVPPPEGQRTSLALERIADALEGINDTMRRQYDRGY